MAYWLMKSEPYKYSFDDLKKAKTDLWDGVRNYQARNNMRKMRIGDLVFFYHSNEGKEIVGIAKVTKEAYPDPTAKKEEQDKWDVVDITYVKPLTRPISLGEIKSTPGFETMALVKNPRLSVQEVSNDHWAQILKLSGTSVS